MTEEELARHDSKTLLQLLLSADARCDALTAERDGLLRCVTDNHVALCRAEAAEAERDRLREALESLHGFEDGWRQCGCGDSCYGRHEERNMVLDHLHDFVTAALKGETNE